MQSLQKGQALPWATVPSQGYCHRQDTGPGFWQFLGTQSPIAYSSTLNTVKVKTRRLVKAGLINSAGELLRCLQWTLSGSRQRLGRKVVPQWLQQIQWKVGNGGTSTKINHVAFPWACQKEGMFYLSQTAVRYYKLYKMIFASTLELSCVCLLCVYVNVSDISLCERMGWGKG